LGSSTNECCKDGYKSHSQRISTGSGSGGRSYSHPGMMVNAAGSSLEKGVNARPVSRSTRGITSLGRARGRWWTRATRM
jgi:hypothetical protein